MSFRPLLIAAGAAALALAGAAFANPHHDRLAQVDANKDGQVQVTEVEARAAQRAAEIDANGDGRITMAEVQAHRQKQREARELARFQRLDANGDGNVSTEEFAGAQSARMAKLDADGDGVIAKEEMRAAHRGPRGHRQRGAD